MKKKKKKKDGWVTLYSDWFDGSNETFSISLRPGSRMKEELRPEFLSMMPYSPCRAQLVPLRLIRKMGEEPFEKVVCKVCRMGDNINLKYVVEYHVYSSKNVSITSEANSLSSFGYRIFDYFD